MFVTRLLSGIVLVVIALVTLIMGGPVLAAVTAGISLIGYMELSRASGIHTKEKKINALETVGLFGTALYYAAIYFCDNYLLALLAIVGVFMGSMCVYVTSFPKYKSEQIMANFFCFVYAPVMLSFLYLTRDLNHGIYIVWLIIISSWGCDTCAYAVGMLIGKHKAFPVLSPKKSWEGCIGGVVGAGLIGWLYSYFVVESAIPEQTVTWIIAFICMVGAVVSQVGDLAASAIKRNHDIKDYGKLIPGHGGIMDRFDSVIVTAPMIYFMAALLIK